MAKLTGLNPEWMDTSGRMPVTKTGHLKRKYENVAYGPDPLQALDIYLPENGDGPFPVIINVHGGGMTSCDKHDFPLYPTLYALERGFAIAAINYRLSPQVKYPTQVYDTKRAILFLAAHSRQYSLDPNNFFLWGTSAGGNLVLMAGMKRGMPLPEELLPANEVPIRGVAALCPEIDMGDVGSFGAWWERLYIWLLFRGLSEKVLGIKKPTPEDLKPTNPHTYLGGGIAPLYLQHGDRDPAVPVNQSLNFAKAVENVLPPEDFVLDILPGVAHAGGGPDFFLPQHIFPILDFFGRHIAQGRPV